MEYYALFSLKIIKFEKNLKKADYLFCHVDYLSIIATLKERKMSKKVLYTLEYPVRCSPVILYEFFTSPAAMQEWFADKVDEKDGVYTFKWNDTEETAFMIEKEQDKFIRFRWSHMAKDEY